MDQLLPASTRCLVCAGSIAPWRTKAGEGVIWRIDRCPSCGFGFVNPRPTLRYLLDFYEGTASIANAPQSLADVLSHEAASPNSTIDSEAMLKRIASLLPSTTGRFLDVGSGYGFFSAAASKRGFAVDAIELGTIQRRISREMTGIEPSATAFEDHSPGEAPYAVVLMSQILEHAHDVAGWMAKSREMLTEGGILAIALPNFDSLARRILQEREPFICPPEHLNFFTATSLARLVEDHGMQVQAIEWVTRVPRSAFARRLPASLQALTPLVSKLADLVTSGVDAARMGSVLRLYARKTKA